MKSSKFDDNIYEEDEFQEAISFSDKSKFSLKIKQLSKDELGMVVYLIKSNCPDAFKTID